MADTTYVPKVYHKQGGDEEVVASGGALTIENGGAFDFQSGGTGFFGSQGITADELKFDLLSRHTITQHASASFVGGSVLSPAYGIHTFSLTTAMSKASAAWPAGASGTILELNFSNIVGDANYSIVVSTSATVYPLGSGAVISNLQISAGGYIKALVLDTDTWAIVEMNNSVSAQALA